MSLNPIELHDDGLRLIKKGTVQGGHRYLCQSNPVLISEILAQRQYRKMIQENNIITWA